eukprot:GHVO01009667.1.p1 GENE.GHVO01009667.1~~GHVO01009667.1.p1  ORF type:complete len:503 (+),score=81.64 GHVO01009667.1:23-1531(+)
MSDSDTYSDSEISYKPSESSSILLDKHASYSHNVPTKPHLTDEEFISRIESIIDEFLVVESTFDVEAALRDLRSTHYYDLFVYKLLRTALDHSLELQSRTAVLISSLYAAKDLTKQHVYRGLEKLIQIIEDLEIDVPNAADRILFFIDCVVEDQILSNVVYYRLPETFIRLLPQEVVEKSETLKNQSKRLRALREKIEDHLLDFFNSGSANECSTFLKELPNDLRPYKFEYVKHLVRASLSKTDTEREMVSQALSTLYGVVETNQLHPDDIQLGLCRLLGTIEDLSLDNPQASDCVSKFLCRSIVDEIIPPAFLQDQRRLHIGGAKGIAVLLKSTKWMSGNSHRHVMAEKFRKIWISTNPDEPETKEFKQEIRDMIYLVLDYQCFEDAVNRVNRMDLPPDQASELVRKILVYTMDRPEYQAEIALQFLLELYTAEEIDNENIEQGFRELINKLSDIINDDPSAPKKIDDYLTASGPKGNKLIDGELEENLRKNLEKYLKTSA